MKRLFITLPLMLMALVAMAVPAKRGLWSVITLTDGTEVSAQLAGDEHVHWMQSADGTCYVKSDGTYVQTSLDALQARRTARMNSRRRAIQPSTADGLGQAGVMSRGAVPSIGEYTIPVVMVQFSDTKFKATTTVEKMRRYYNEEGYSDERCAGSVRDYFVAQSGGQFVPNFDVVGIVTLDKKASYYGKNDRDGNDDKLEELPRDVTAAAVEQLQADFSAYVVPAGDRYHHAGVPLLVMFYAGRSEATEAETYSDLIWPCEWDGTEDYIAQGNYQGVHFNSFFVGNELYTGGFRLMGPGVFCHEFGHALGLPDFYCTDGSYENDDAFGMWSIMDCGAYEGDSYKPMGYTAYEKSYMGWLDMPEVDNAAEVTLMSPEGRAEGSACIIRSSSTETFILENRQPGTWYPTVYGSGVLLTRIAYRSTDWLWNTVNNTQAKKRACVMTANGAKLSFSAHRNNMYGNLKSAIGTVKTLSGAGQDLGVTGITKNSDGTITLTFTQSTPEPEPEGVLFHETFDQCNGTGGNDGGWSALVATANFNPDNEGWVCSSAYGAQQCAKFGTAKVAGEATTPAFALNGTARLTFRAGAWNGLQDDTKLNLAVSEGTVSPAQVNIVKGGFSSHEATLTATGDVQLTFSTGKGRFFLDDVLVTVEASGIKTMVGTTPPPTRCYTPDGRYAGSDVSTLPHGLYIVNGRKVVR